MYTATQSPSSWATRQMTWPLTSSAADSVRISSADSWGAERTTSVSSIAWATWYVWDPRTSSPPSLATSAKGESAGGERSSSSPALPPEQAPKTSTIPAATAPHRPGFMARKLTAGGRPNPLTHGRERRRVRVPPRWTPGPSCQARSLRCRALLCLVSGQVGHAGLVRSAVVRCCASSPSWSATPGASSSLSCAAGLPPSGPPDAPRSPPSRSSGLRSSSSRRAVSGNQATMIAAIASGATARTPSARPNDPSPVLQVPGRRPARRRCRPWRWC